MLWNFVVVVIDLLEFFQAGGVQPRFETGPYRFLIETLRHEMGVEKSSQTERFEMRERAPLDWREILIYLLFYYVLLQGLANRFEGKIISTQSSRHQPT